MSPMNTNQHKDYQTVLEEQTPLVCDEIVENNSSTNRHLTLLSVGIAVFALFVAMTGHMSHATTARTIADLQATLAAHEVDISAAAFTTSVVQSTPLLGAAGSKGEGVQCLANSECGSNLCEDRRYSFCSGKEPDLAPLPPKVCQGDNCTYRFVSSLDSGGGDCGIGWSSGNAASLRKKCNNLPGCVGFNTSGWLKCTLKPQSEWTRFTNNPYQGTYVKN